MLQSRTTPLLQVPLLAGLIWLLLYACACSARPVAVFDVYNYSWAQHLAPDACRVLHAPRGPILTLPSGIEELFDIIVTDDRQKVEFLQASGKYYFLEDREYPVGDFGRVLAQQKETLPIDARRQGMSLLLPKDIRSEEMVQVLEDAAALMPQSVFVDNGTAASRHQAVADFTFAVLLNGDEGVPPQTVVDCFAHGTVPILIGRQNLLNYTHFFAYAVVKFLDFNVEQAITFMLDAPQDAFYVYANAVKVVQEFFHMRYKAPFGQRLQRHAAMACHALAQPSPVLAFVSIYSSKSNFGRRMALRDTWLPLLWHEGVIHKFFLAGLDVGGGSPLDRLLRMERDYFDDMVFLAGTTDEYPIGRKGLAALQWVAGNTDAQFWLKLDDDIYLRPGPLFRAFRHMQRAESYWGTFDYSGQVVRDISDPHFTSYEVWAEEVFPPYARGAALAMSMDLVRQIAEQEAQQPFKKIIVEDVSYGFFLWQLVHDREGGAVTLLDNNDKHFAMDPKCCTEASHPNNCWLPLGQHTWIVHHVSPKTVRCMFATDVAMGLYEPAGLPPVDRQSLQALLSDMLAFDSNVRSAFGIAQVGGIRQRPGWEGQALPELCSCVITPPPHPGQPKMGDVMKETAAGPRLYVD